MKIVKKGVKKGTLVFVHGSSCSSRIFEEILEDNDLQHSIVLIDLPGHGENHSPTYNERSFTINAYSDFLLTEISKIDDDIILVGNSLGGHLVMEIAQQVKRLSGIVINGAPPVKSPLNFEEAFVDLPALKTFFTPEPSQKDVVQAVEIAVNNENKREVIIQDFNKTNPLVRSVLAREILSGKLQDELSILESLVVPKFILIGSDDATVKKRYMNFLRNKNIERLKFIEIKESGHYPSLENPKAYNEAINRVSTNIFGL